jgi:hypothetical protein
MSYHEELEINIEKIKKNVDVSIYDLEHLSAMRERVRLFNHIRDLIQQKDSHNDIVAAEVLAWALGELASSPYGAQDI